MSVEKVKQGAPPHKMSLLIDIEQNRPFEVEVSLSSVLPSYVGYSSYFLSPNVKFVIVKTDYRSLPELSSVWPRNMAWKHQIWH